MKFKFKFLIIVFLLVLSMIYLFSGNPNSEIILKLRLPRLLIGFFVGAGLSVSGAVFQAILRNPLAEPYTLGISGIVILLVNLNALIFGLPNSFVAILGAIFSIILLYSILSTRRQMLEILLIGIIINILCIALVELLANFAQETSFFASKFWLMGTLSALPINWLILAISMFLVIFCGIVFFINNAKILDILSLGEKQAIFLGVDVKRKQRIFLVVASIIAGFCIAYTGIIGFVGLMIPHIVRFMFGPNHRNMIIFCSLIGGIYLVFADFFAKTLFYPKELSVGVITGIFGAIFFIIFVLRKKYE